MVMIDQVPWHEMNVGQELTVRTEDGFCRGLETQLRRRLYAWRHMRVDMVVEPVIDVPMVFHDDGYGISRVERTAVGDPANDVVGHYYLDQLANDDDLGKLHAPHVRIDRAATEESAGRTGEIFEGLLRVRLIGYQPWFCPWDMIVQWHGVENTLLDLVDRPEFMHRVIGRLTAAQLELFDSLEAQGALPQTQTLVHCTGAYTDGLPAAGYDPQRPRGQDIWAPGMAQVFSTVSPAMHDEFEIQYVRKLFARVGRGYYGCCEPLHDKVELVRKIPNVRKISMSPWVDVERGARAIGRDFVFSRKPSPAFLATDSPDLDGAIGDLGHTAECCAREGCPVEFILKDISTVRYRPQVLWEWAERARRLAKGQ
jgi:hypothetical protein